MKEDTNLTDLECKAKMAAEATLTEDGQKKIRESIKYVEHVLDKLKEERRIPLEVLETPFGM